MEKAVHLRMGDATPDRWKAACREIFAFTDPELFTSDAARVTCEPCRTTTLVVHQDYVVTSQLKGVQKKPRTMRAGYLGPGGPGGDELQFDCRGPDRTTRGQYGGTQSLRQRNLVSFRLVERNLAERYTERMA